MARPSVLAPRIFPQYLTWGLIGAGHKYARLVRRVRMVKSFKNRVGRAPLTHPLLKERLLRQAESRKTVSRSFGYENRRLCFRTTRC